MNIIEVQFLTADLSSLKDFYTKVLCLPLVSEGSNSFTLKAGATKITFQKSKTADNPYYHFALNIPENKIEEAREWMTGKAELLKENENEIIDFKNWNAHSIYFYDTAGNVVELIARHNLANASDEKFSGSSILCVSEIGMPADDVGAVTEFIDVQLGQKLWSGDNKTFAAVGDENGLLIIVPTNRNWFPTDKQSKIFPLVIKIEGENGGMTTFENLPYRIITIPKSQDFISRKDAKRNTNFTN